MVLATNIAEINLTIEGIRLVVDSGLERVAEFDPRSRLDRLTTRLIKLGVHGAARGPGRTSCLAGGSCCSWGISEIAQLSWLVDARPTPLLPPRC